MFSFKNTNMNWADESEIQTENKCDCENIVVTDKDDSLVVYHYTKCEDNSSDYLKRHRGVVYDLDNKIVCKTFGYIDEIQTHESDKLEKSIHSFNQCKFFKAVEGAYIRLFFHDNKWYLSTHRKLNAFKSKWGDYNSDSFGKMFTDALKWNIDNRKLNLEYEDYSNILDVYTNTLDKNKNYLFIVSNNSKNRIVCDAPKNPSLYFAGSFDRSTHLYIEGNDSGIDGLFTLDFNNLNSLLEYVNDLDHKETPGVIVYLPNQRQVKIMNSKYHALFKIRGNEPSIKFRYLQVRNNPHESEQLKLLYPDCIGVFSKYEEKITLLCEKIYNSYVDRFINRKYVSLPKREHLILAECHTEYKKTRERMTLEKVRFIISNKKPYILNRLLKYIKTY